MPIESEGVLLINRKLGISIIFICATLFMTFTSQVASSNSDTAEVHDSKLESSAPQSGQNSCMQLKKERPDLSEVIDVTASGDANRSIRAMAKDCWKGVKGAWSDTLKALLMDPYEYLSQQSAITQTYLTSCLESKLCKSNLYFDAYEHYPDEYELSKLNSIAAVAVLNKKAISRRDSSGEQDKRLIQKLRNQQWLEGSRPIDLKQDSQPFWSSISAKLDQYRTKWSCLKPEVANEYFCYNLAMIIDPTIAAGLVAKSPALGKILAKAPPVAGQADVPVLAAATKLPKTKVERLMVPGEYSSPAYRNAEHPAWAAGFQSASKEGDSLYRAMSIDQSSLNNVHDNGLETQKTFYPKEGIYASQDSTKALEYLQNRNKEKRFLGMFELDPKGSNLARYNWAYTYRQDVPRSQIRRVWIYDANAQTSFPFHGYSVSELRKALGLTP